MGGGVKEQRLSLKRAARVGIIALVVVSAAGYGVARFRDKAKPVVKTGRTVPVRRGDLTVKVSETGTLEPTRQVEVKSRVGGRVLRIYVREGDRVSPGTLIALVDPTEVARDVERVKAQRDAARAGLLQSEENYIVSKRQNELAIQRAEASLAEAKARFAQTAAPTRQQEVEQQEAAIRRIEAQLADARRNLARRMTLVDKGFVARSEADTVETQVALAEADLASAKQRLSLLKEGARREDVAISRAAITTARVQLETERANAAQVELRKRDIQRAKAEIAQIENTLAQQSVQLSETRIVAPIGGEVVGKYLEEGELVASATAGFAQGAAIVRIADLNRMQVRVNVNEVDVVRVRNGQQVEIRADGVPDKIFPGRVAAIAPSSLAENQQTSSSGGGGGSSAVVRFEVKVEVVSPDRRLRPGMTASVGILLARRKNTLLLPTEALRPGNKVTVITGTGETLKKEERTIKIGLRNDATVEVLSGLTEKDKVEVPKVEASDRRKVEFNND